ncbi:MAG: M56 family metallopeptidase [Phycisphaerales bacterium]
MLNDLTAGWRLLADAAWQSTLILGVALLAAWLLSRRPARAHAILLCGLAAAIALPLASAAARLAGLGLFRPAAVAEPTPSTPAGEWLVPTATADAAFSLLPIVATGLLIAWAFVSGVLLVRLAILIVRTRRFVRLAVPLACVDLSRRIRRAAIAAGSASPLPMIRVHPSIAAPAAVGLIGHRCLVVPADLDRLSDDELAAVLAHELAHLRRRDHLGALLADAFVAVLPWQPLGWLARRRTALLRELTCDAWAVRAVPTPADYARLLYRFAARLSAASDASSTATPPASLAMAAGDIRRRVDATLDDRQREPAAGRAWLGGLLVASVLVVGGLSVMHVRKSTPGPATVLASGQGSPLGGWEDPKIVGGKEGESAPLLVSARELDFGIVAPGEAADRTLSIFNPGRRGLVIEAIRAGCGCTTLEFDGPVTLAAGASIDLPVRMKADDKPDVVKRKSVSIVVRDSRPLTVYVQIASTGAAADDTSDAGELVADNANAPT